MPKTRAEYKYTEAIQTMAPLLWNAYGVLVLFLRCTRYLKISKRS